MSVKVESKITQSNCSDEELFDFLSDFTRFTRMLPPQYLSHITSTPTECHINAGVMGSITLTYGELDRPKLIKICPTTGSDMMKIWVQLKPVADYDTRIKVTVSVDAGFMAKMMIKNQLKQFADGLADGIAHIRPHMLH